MIGVAILTLLQAASPLQAARSDSTSETREARLRPYLVEDALYSIPGVAWQMERVGDLDGDELDDLIVQRGGLQSDRGRFADWGSRGGWGNPTTAARIEAVSARDGELIRSLWTYEDMVEITWDAGADLNGDSRPDLIVGQPGSVVAVSGADGELLREVTEPSDNPYTRSVALLEDVDGDGRAEFVVGAPGGPDLLGWVSLYSGRDGSLLWRIEGGEQGDGFGIYVSALGDVNGDGSPDLAVASVPDRDRPLLIVSCADGGVIAELEDNGGPFGAAGDVDGDGLGDIFLGALVEDTEDIDSEVPVITTVSEVSHFDLLLPDHPFGSPYSKVIPLGDVDGDRVPDFLLGNANLNVRADETDSTGKLFEGPDLGAMTLQEAVALGSDPWCAFTWHSGAAWVRSGRNQELIMGVWGPPGERQGMGLAGCSVPDLDGDGMPEIAIVQMDGAYVFPGPGARPEETK